MDRRLELQKILSDILGSDNVYFQPPASVRMQYPCIVYERSSINSEFADNRPYSLTDQYQVTVIDRKPKSHISDEIARLPMCRMTTHFVADNLNHDIFTLHF